MNQKNARTCAKQFPKSKPCLRLQYCPYGVLVENFPLVSPVDPTGCGVFFHACPAFFVAESVVDDIDAAFLNRVREYKVAAKREATEAANHG